MSIMTDSHRYLMTCRSGKSALNALSKAPADVSEILSREGFEIIVNDYLLRNRILRIPLVLITPLIQAARIKRGSLLLYQHPYDTEHKAIRTMNGILRSLLRGKDVKTSVLVHDVDSVRFHETSLQEEVAILNSFDSVIVHSSNMKSLLMENGLTSPCRILGLFDYLYSEGNTQPRSRDGGVCYAGNLEKSTFLKDIHKIGIPCCLYGACPPSIPAAENVRYEGRFAPENLSSLKGGWGLVWDGESIDGPEGRLGEYLRYNSPHKASMYVCAGLPLIVPSWSAIADTVRKNNLGIVVRSLTDIKSAVDAVSQEAYDAMVASLSEYAGVLSDGGHIKAALMAPSEQ